MQQTNNSPDQHLIAFENACRNSGMRITYQRLEIFREITAASDHPTAEVLHQRLRKRIPTLSLDTVYRTLATFAEHDLIHKVETIQSQGRFEFRHDEHHHLICSRCHKIVDFTWNDLDHLPVPDELATWGAIERRSVVIYGVCRDCLSAPRE